MAGQLRQMGEFLTQQTGLPLDDGQLARTVARSQRTMALYHRGLRLRAGRQVLSDLTSELLRTAAFHFLLGTPETEAYARQLLGEITTAPPRPGQAAALDSHHPPTGWPPCGTCSPRAPGSRWPPAT